LKIEEFILKGFMSLLTDYVFLYTRLNYYLLFLLRELETLCQHFNQLTHVIIN